MRVSSGRFFSGRFSLPAILFLIMTTFGATSCAAETSLVAMDVGGHSFMIELAVTPEERQQGLMFREELKPDHGMLFVFPESAVRSFWMKDTAIPLSIAFISAEGTILEIRQLEPLSLEPVQSRYPARYALEVNQGRFRALGIGPGDTVEIEKLPESLRR
jgi:uncharacterized protein